MRALVFIHGIIGARMELDGEPIWPPTVPEYIGGYDRIDKLLTQTAVATEIIDRFHIGGPFYKKIYSQIIDDLKLIASQTGSFTEFVHYDWRLDNWVSGTEVLAHAMRRVDARASSITLVCHSMGGLIARLMLETGKYKGDPWVKKLERVIFVCTPHLGAARPLGLALGNEKYFGIKKEDVHKLLNDSRYPAGFECISDRQTQILYDASDTPPTPQDIYLPTVDERFKLTRSNVVALEHVRELLNNAVRIEGPQYTLVAGTGESTPTAFSYKNNVYDKTAYDGKTGDGTVTLTSAIPEGMGVRVKFPGEHLGIIDTPGFRDFLFLTLGGTKPERRMIDGKPEIIVSLQKDFADPGEIISLLLIPDGDSSEIKGILTISKLNLAAAPFLTDTQMVAEFSYSGAPVTHLRSDLAAPNVPGTYIIEFEGSHRTDKENAAILVVG
ncbi:hypothetical protein [Bradyrhizobium sp. OAE829]|uniref:lipase/acyltransferase domain-containing protein n=1 Tax=Bradyrhizobium sp. OAE829 TaxID=2663807 RepID=UPI00178AB567